MSICDAWQVRRVSRRRRRYRPCVQDWRRHPGHGKYAHPERERRFLLAEQPLTDGPVWRIEDRYLTGTNLRLRRVTLDEESVYKLTQKVRVAVDDPYEVAITNMYLTADEYRQLLILPAAVLVKDRQVVDVDGVRFAVDAFRGKLKGLCLAETEADRRDAPLPRPTWLATEVTEDDRYSGGRLAHANDEEAARLVAT